MAFEGLTEKLQGAFKKLSGKGKLTEVALADLPKLMEAAKEETNAD